MSPLEEEAIPGDTALTKAAEGELHEPVEPESSTLPPPPPWTGGNAASPLGTAELVVPGLSAGLAVSRPKIVWPGPSSETAGVIGYPVRHSLSPRLHNAALAVLGLDWCYLAFEVPPGLFEKAVTGAAALGLRGLSVTMPHKDAAAKVATRHSRQVRRLGAANTLVFEAGTIRAESCDGDGLLDDLREALGFDPAGRRCGVIGAGGAGRATVLALAEAGAAEVIVVNRTPARAWRSVALAPKVAHVGRPEELKDLELVVQATPTAMPAAPGGSVARTGQSPRSRSVRQTAPPPKPGPRIGPFGLPVSPAKASGFRPGHQSAGGAASQMGGAEVAEDPGDPLESPSLAKPPRGDLSADDKTVVAGVDAAWFGAGQLVVDLVYEPPLTPFLLEAEQHGATIRGGLGMLVHQAARQIRLWTGLEPPLQVMWAVVTEQWQPASGLELAESQLPAQPTKRVL